MVIVGKFGVSILFHMHIYTGIHKQKYMGSIEKDNTLK